MREVKNISVRKIVTTKKKTTFDVTKSFLLSDERSAAKESKAEATDKAIVTYAKTGTRKLRTIWNCNSTILSNIL